MHKRLRSKTRAGIKALTCVAFAAALATFLPDAAQARLPQPIYFWGSVAEIIRAPGQIPLPEVIRPSRIFLFADGSWDIDHLHWRGWGSSARHATGISSASNGIPNHANGKRIKHQVESPCRIPDGSTAVRCTAASR
jgi:hypothetical protein